MRINNYYFILFSQPIIPNNNLLGIFYYFGLYQAKVDITGLEEKREFRLRNQSQSKVFWLCFLFWKANTLCNLLCSFRKNFGNACYFCECFVIFLAYRHLPCNLFLFQKQIKMPYKLLLKEVLWIATLSTNNKKPSDFVFTRFIFLSSFF